MPLFSPLFVTLCDTGRISVMKPATPPTHVTDICALSGDECNCELSTEFTNDQGYRRQCPLRPVGGVSVSPRCLASRTTALENTRDEKKRVSVHESGDAARRGVMDFEVPKQSYSGLRSGEARSKATRIRLESGHWLNRGSIADY